MAGDRYSGKVALVTGARKGIGQALSLHLLDQGARVVGLSRQTATIDHAWYTHHVCDVRDAEQVRATVREIGKDSPVNILINSAGVLNSKHSVMLTASSAEEMLLTNLLGPFLVSREAAKVMKKTGSGRIINIGSMTAVLEPVGDSVYAACKAGLATMTNVLAKELAAFKITCNTVGVTAFETDMLAQLPRGTVDSVIAGLPIPRYAQADDIFNVVDFFASDRSSYITAQTVYLGGVHG